MCRLFALRLLPAKRIGQLLQLCRQALCNLQRLRVLVQMRGVLPFGQAQVLQVHRSRLGLDFEHGCCQCLYGCPASCVLAYVDAEHGLQVLGVDVVAHECPFLWT